VGGNFLSHSTQNTGWNTTAATLEFITGGGNTLEHVLDLTGWNLGPGTGYTNNFAWGTLTIDVGNTLELEDGLTGNPDAALYVADIIGALINGDAISNIIGNGLDIYYDPSLTANAYLGGRDFALVHGGELVATPEPGTLAVLLLGLAAGIVLRRRRGTGSNV
jgi:PEP-CTERM motif